MYQITNTGKYLRVEFKVDTTLQEILAAFYEIVKLPEHPQMNDIWVFGNFPAFLKFDDLNTILQEIVRVYPRGVQRNKTALVTNSGFNNFLAEDFERIAQDLPFQVKVFRAVPDAEMWLG